MTTRMTIKEIERRLRFAAPDEPAVLPRSCCRSKPRVPAPRRRACDHDRSRGATSACCTRSRRSCRARGSPSRRADCGCCRTRTTSSVPTAVPTGPWSSIRMVRSVARWRCRTAGSSSAPASCSPERARRRA